MEKTLDQLCKDIDTELKPLGEEFDRMLEESYIKHYDFLVGKHDQKSIAMKSYLLEVNPLPRVVEYLQKEIVDLEKRLASQKSAIENKEHKRYAFTRYCSSAYYLPNSNPKEQERIVLQNAMAVWGSEMCQWDQESTFENARDFVYAMIGRKIELNQKEDIKSNYQRLDSFFTENRNLIERLNWFDDAESADKLISLMPYYDLASERERVAQVDRHKGCMEDFSRDPIRSVKGDLWHTIHNMACGTPVFADEIPLKLAEIVKKSEEISKRYSRSD